MTIVHITNTHISVVLVQHISMSKVDWGFSLMPLEIKLCNMPRAYIKVSSLIYKRPFESSLAPISIIFRVFRWLNDIQDIQWLDQLSLVARQVGGKSSPLAHLDWMLFTSVGWTKYDKSVHNTMFRKYK